MDAVVKLSRGKKWINYGWICNEKERGEIKLIYSVKADIQRNEQKYYFMPEEDIEEMVGPGSRTEVR